MGNAWTAPAVVAARAYLADMQSPDRKKDPMNSPVALRKNWLDAYNATQGVDVIKEAFDDAVECATPVHVNAYYKDIMKYAVDPSGSPPIAMKGIEGHHQFTLRKKELQYIIPEECAYYILNHLTYAETDSAHLKRYAENLKAEPTAGADILFQEVADFLHAAAVEQEMDGAIYKDMKADAEAKLAQSKHYQKFMQHAVSLDDVPLSSDIRVGDNMFDMSPEECASHILNHLKPEKSSPQQLKVYAQKLDKIDGEAHSRPKQGSLVPTATNVNFFQEVARLLNATADAK
jgi:hypothetical protein